MSLLTPEIIEDICGQFNQDGVRFRLVDLDEDNERVRLLLDLSEVECADCVMPPEHLRRLITTGIRQRSAKVFDVVLDDPRREQRKGNGLAAAAGTVEVLDPTAPAEASDADSGPDVGALQGKTVLIRLDTLWRSWDWTTEEWEKQLEALGARVLTIRRTRGVPGTQGVRLQAEFEEAARSSDALISGLGNCGACTSATIRDALTGLRCGTPTVAVLTGHFLPVAKVLAEEGRLPGLRMHTLPYPLNNRPQTEVRQIARKAFAGLLSALGARI